MAYVQNKEKKVIRVPLIGIPTYRGTNASLDQQYVNLFVEKQLNPLNNGVVYYATKRPGLLLHSSVTAGTGRGIYSWQGHLYSVVGTNIYKDAVSIYSTLATSTGLVDFIETLATASTVYLCMNDGVNLYLIKADNTVTVITSGQFQSATITNSGSGYTNGTYSLGISGDGTGATGTYTVSGNKVTSITVTARGQNYTTITLSFPSGGGTNAAATADICAFPNPNLGNVVFFDTYTIVADSKGNIWNSHINDPTQWEATDFINAQAFPDDLVGIARQNDMLLAFGQWSTQMFYDAANPSPGSFMANLAQATLQIGAASRDSIVQHENFIIWVSRAMTGGYTVQKLDGITSLKRISTEPIERLLNQEGTNISASYAYVMRSGGHFFYILNLTSAQRTLVYDIEMEAWTEWMSGSSGLFNGVAAIQQDNLSHIQGATDGNIYHVDFNTYQDNGAAINVSLQTIKEDFDTQRRKFCARFELIGDRTTTTNPVTIRYTDDDYQTYSTARTVDMAILSTNDRPMLERLGTFRRRAWKFTHSANQPLRLEALEIEAQIGEY